ncbi:transposase [Mesorhizobium sp. CA18]|nr:transposase [Mesorhizobium sp. CA9]MBZ9824572.1 transposase [Mesorhizobium sp. CA18]MBZ9829470.1 transposase [Mesorhizobium sp. CA2]MBZ9837169.1 transposase [Mesorhizobium sp. CA3]MBZ9877940.1 transposase [Mesorhizobium sp. Ca11]MBZ9900745.1 transposase [Mesorhizobium sp. CA17]
MTGCDWARIRRPWTSKGGFEHWLLVRRKRSTSGEKAYYLVFAPPGSSLAELAAVAGLRWAVEECFERAKDDLGLDHCEARSWHGWHRHMSLCMTALAFLSKLSADLRRSAWSKPNETSPKGQSPPDSDDCARSERPRDPLSPRPDPHLPTDTKALHHRLAAVATTTSGRGSHLSLQTARISATVVLMPKIEDLAGCIATSIVRVDGSCRCRTPSTAEYRLAILKRPPASRCPEDIRCARNLIHRHRSKLAFFG